jgi:GNAT superfamily N-acetyltransferase
MMNYKVINYSKDYKEEVLAAIDQGYKDIGYSGIELDSLDDDLNNIEESFKAPSIFKLVFDGDLLIATYALKIKDNKAELKRVYVQKEYRGKGIAKQISQEAFTYAASLGIEKLDIWSGTHCQAAHNLYQKLGAIKTDQQRELGGKDQVIEYHFEKSLT